MSTVFKNQGYFSLVLDTGIDLSAASNPRIYYKKPNETSGYFVATISGTTLTYQFANNQLNFEGTWKFQAYVEIGGLKAWGEIVEQRIKNPL